MGSRASKLQPTAELSAALRPICRKIEEVKNRRRKRSRRDSIVSSTELLHADERDVTDAGSGSSRKAGGEEDEVCAAPVQLPKVEEEEVQYLTSDEGPEEVAKKQQAAAAAAAAAAEEEEEGRKLRAVTARRGSGREELPGSPSFRIYFPGPIHDPYDEPVILEQLKTKDELGKTPKSVAAHRRTSSKAHSNSNEDLESKGQEGKKAARMRKWRVITKANMAVHYMNVRSCYTVPTCMDAKQGSSGFLTGKAA